MENTNKSRFERLDRFIRSQINPNPSLFLKAKVFLDVLWERLRYDNELIDYEQYRFYFKSRPERNRFVTHGKLLEIMKVCNDPESRKIFDDKVLFNQYFKDYLGRESLDAREASLDDISTFINKHQNVFAKDPKGMFGKGIFMLKASELDDKVLTTIKSHDYLLEEVVSQHEALAAFNPDSVNSLRVVTLRKASGEIEIMCAVQRIGRKGRVADNFHHEGIAALIDIKTGIIYTQGVDRHWNRYTLHPDSKVPIVGFKIPYWEEVKNLVLEAAQVHPEVRYVGWDVAIGPEGKLMIIEGNPGADPDVTQIPDQVGKWPNYEPLLEEIRKLG